MRRECPEAADFPMEMADYESIFAIHDPGTRIVSSRSGPVEMKENSVSPAPGL
jgi:hypothetical protein